MEKSELQARIALLQGERKGQENLKNDLIRRIKMLEYCLKQERAKYHKLKYGTDPPDHNNDTTDELNDLNFELDENVNNNNNKNDGDQKNLNWKQVSNTTSIINQLMNIMFCFFLFVCLILIGSSIITSLSSRDWLYGYNNRCSFKSCTSIIRTFH